MADGSLRSVDVLCSDGEFRKARFAKGVDPVAGANCYVVIDGMLHYGFVIQDFPDDPRIAGPLEFISDVEVSVAERREQEEWEAMSEEEQNEWYRQEDARFRKLVEADENEAMGESGVDRV